MMIFKRLAALLLLTAQAAATTPEMAAAERAGEPSTTELEAEMVTTAPVELDGNVLFRVDPLSLSGRSFS